MGEDVDDDAPPAEPRAMSGGARLAVGCLVALLLVVVGASWALASFRGRQDEECAIAIRRVLDPAPLEFDEHGLAQVLVYQGVGQSFEVQRQDQARVKAALAPLGEVRSVALLEVGPRSPHRPLSVRCRVEGTRGAGDVTFVFQPRDLPLHVWWGLTSATIER